MDSTEDQSHSPLETDLRVLIVEDSKIEAKFTVNLLKKNGYSVVHERVETEEEMVAALEEHKWDIIISDYQMPDFDGMRALQVFQRYNLDIPFILVSGKIGEETAVDLMKMGAYDYIMKGNTARLVPAVRSHLKDAANRRENLRLEKRLKESEAQYRGFFENAHIGIFRCSDHGVILDANQRLSSAFGYDSIKDFIKSVEVLKPEIAGESSRKVEIVKLYELAQKDAQAEVQFHRQDGSILEAKLNVWMIQEDPEKPVYLEGVIEDITEQKKVERKLREMEELHESLIDLTSNM
ncbi:MAG: response regulator [Verrucomicrobiota bacterium]|nr:response regulator [Verrucomicrobiota bacterium]